MTIIQSVSVEKMSRYGMVNEIYVSELVQIWRVETFVYKLTGMNVLSTIFELISKGISSILLNFMVSPVNRIHVEFDLDCGQVFKWWTMTVKFTLAV